MITIERRILKAACSAAASLPDSRTEKDSRYALDTVNAVMAALIQAEEPVNKACLFHEQAQRSAKALAAFIEHRGKEMWRPDSTFDYGQKTVTAINA
ncbi:hypothetical protein [Metabacillus sp. SLBN-84]